MTTEGEWKKFTGSREQVIEMINSKNGYILKNGNRQSDRLTQGFDLNEKFRCKDDGYEEYWTIEEYWIIPYDPLREMKIRQAQTGQPVWVRKPWVLGVISEGVETYCTTEPDWNIPDAEYSFTPFEE